MTNKKIVSTDLSNNLNIKTNKKNLHVDESDESTVKGWATCSSNLDSSVLVSIESTSNSVCFIANQYRADVRRVGLHNTGLCGYEYDISDWVDKKITVSALAAVDNNQVSDYSPSFFVHIPKTAGTSFKRAAEKYFGKNGVVRNYGDKSVESTPWINQVVLQEKNFPKLYQRLRQEGVGLYTGHLTALPTVNVFPIEKVVTFIRNPVDQVLSHYHHYARWYGYEESVEKFVRNPGFKDLQTRHLKGLPLQLIGFVGVTEKYSESIELYNSFSGFNFEVREDNTNSHNTKAKISDELLGLISENNKKDNSLYKKVVTILDQRSNMAQAGKEWCYSFIDQLDKKSISGVAYMEASDEVVDLIVKHNDNELGRCTANSFRPGLVQFGVKNNGFIGFFYPLPSNVDCQNITVEVESTGQVLQRKFII